MRVDQPQPGLYKTRATRGAPWQPVRIWYDHPIDPHTGQLLDRPIMLRCTAAGKERCPYAMWSWCAGHPVDPTEFAYLEDLLIWSDSIGVSRAKRADLNNMPVL